MLIRTLLIAALAAMAEAQTTTRTAFAHSNAAAVGTGTAVTRATAVSTTSRASAVGPMIGPQPAPGSGGAGGAVGGATGGTGGAGGALGGATGGAGGAGGAAGGAVGGGAGGAAAGAGGAVGGGAGGAGTGGVAGGAGGAGGAAGGLGGAAGGAGGVGGIGAGAGGAGNVGATGNTCTAFTSSDSICGFLAPAQSSFASALDVATFNNTVTPQLNMLCPNARTVPEIPILYCLASLGRCNGDTFSLSAGMSDLISFVNLKTLQTVATNIGQNAQLPCYSACNTAVNALKACTAIRNLGLSQTADPCRGLPTTGCATAPGQGPINVKKSDARALAVSPLVVAVILGMHVCL
ncbi:hypothetical protein HDU96_003306 [Phlyctochytrium bullatum]|nr:hypothetical protein HDU96_003306 [Phlyctochytrium bullatum]